MSFRVSVLAVSSDLSGGRELCNSAHCSSADLQADDNDNDNDTLRRVQPTSVHGVAFTGVSEGGHNPAKKNLLCLYALRSWQGVHLGHC